MLHLDRFKTFDGQKYEFYPVGYRSKKSAQVAAEAIRNSGRKVRMVGDEGHGWFLYVRG